MMIVQKFHCWNIYICCRNFIVIFVLAIGHNLSAAIASDLSEENITYRALPLESAFQTLSIGHSSTLVWEKLVEQLHFKDDR
jgi:hypothetical protein